MSSPALSKLSQKRRQFVLAYVGEAEGNATKAAKLAGYANPRQMGSRLTKVDQVNRAIEEVRVADESPKIMDRARRKALLSRIASGEEADIYIIDKEFQEGAPQLKSRLKAIETLGRMEGDYLERLELSGSTQAVVMFGDNRGKTPKGKR